MPTREERAESYKAMFGEYPKGYKTPEQKLKDVAIENKLNLVLNPTHQDSVMYDRLNPGKKSIFAKPEQKQTYDIFVPGMQDTIKGVTPSKYYDFMVKTGRIKGQEKPKTPKQLYEDRYYSLLLKSKNDKLSSAEMRELDKMQKDKGSKNDNEKSYEQLVKEWEKMGDIENAAVETGEVDPKTGLPKTKPFYPESARNIAGSKKTAAEIELKWKDISNETGIPIDQAKTVYEQGKAAILPIMQDFKSGKLPYSPEGLKQVLNDKLAPLGIDYEDLLEFDKRLSQ